MAPIKKQHIHGLLSDIKLYDTNRHLAWAEKLCNINMLIYNGDMCAKCFQCPYNIELNYSFCTRPWALK